MPGPMSTGQARRRNAPKQTTLPADRRTEPAPDPPGKLTKSQRELYDWAWSLPVAANWHWSDAELVADWARLKALAAKYLAGQVRRKGDVQDLPSSLLQQILNREDRLMMSPTMRKRGHVKLEQPTPEGAGDDSSGTQRQGNVVTPGRWQRTGAAG